MSDERTPDEQPPASEPVQPEQASIPLAQFLESVSPGQVRKVTAQMATTAIEQGRAVRFRFSLPEIQLHCPSDACNGERFFRADEDGNELTIRGPNWNFEYVKYKCANCQKQEKTFSLAIMIQALDQQQPIAAHCYKFGELPAYGPPTPSRLISLLGPGRELFLKGRRCEIQGLGIGAFVYYRRVVEDQKSRILAEIIKVAQTISAPQETIAALQAAQAEHQFSKAMDDVKDAIPQRLLINGQNPLSLLHAALSRGLHNHTDETCLELATDIRVILAELAELLSHALKDERELREAVGRLSRLPTSPTGQSDSR
jgi:hypothetical protein